MKPIIYSLTAVLALLPGLWSSVAIAQSPPIRFTPSQQQQLSGGLYHTSSEDFFNQGQQQLENEIKLLERRDQFLKEGVLKISEDLQIRSDLSQYERPGAQPLRQPK